MTAICDLYELIIERWLGSRTLAANGIIVLAQREALLHGLLARRPREGRLPLSLRWAESLPCFVGDSAALTNVEAAAKRLSEDLAALEKDELFGSGSPMTAS
jgi:hypothetical protein